MDRATVSTHPTKFMCTRQAPGREVKDPMRKNQRRFQIRSNINHPLQRWPTGLDDLRRVIPFFSYIYIPSTLQGHKEGLRKPVARICIADQLIFAALCSSFSVSYRRRRQRLWASLLAKLPQNSNNLHYGRVSKQQVVDWMILPFSILPLP